MSQNIRNYIFNEESLPLIVSEPCTCTCECCCSDNNVLRTEPMGPLSTHTFGKKEGKKDTLDTGRPAKYSRTHTLQESPEHSHHNSWAIEEEEDPAIRWVNRVTKEEEDPAINSVH